MSTMSTTRFSGLWKYPARIWWIALALIFTVEYSLMFALPWFFPVEPWGFWPSTFDALLLTVVVSPVIWWTCVEPLHQFIKMRSRYLADLFMNLEVERRRIADELHDGVGQPLTLLISGLRTLSDQSEQPDVARRMRELRQIAQLALKDIRQIALGLRPSLLDDLGLAPALERVAAEVQEYHPMRLCLDVTAVVGLRFPAAIETALFRIFQEAINNIVKHSAAKQASAQIQLDDSAVILRIDDDGCGFDPGHLGGGKPGSGQLGLIGMRQRVTLLGGTLNIETKPGCGTHVTACLPVEVPSIVAGESCLR